MIGALFALQFIKMQEEARSAQAQYDAMQCYIADTADNLARYEAIKRAEYGRDAIDVEARVVPDAPLIENKN